MKKLIKSKDKNNIGKLNYMDFSKWLGNSIHQSEGFYFRHDSIKNPQYERFMHIEDLNKAEDKLQANICLIKGDDVEDKILEKIKF